MHHVHLYGTSYTCSALIIPVMHRFVRDGSWRHIACDVVRVKLWSELLNQRRSPCIKLLWAMYNNNWTAVWAYCVFSYNLLHYRTVVIMTITLTAADTATINVTVIIIINSTWGMIGVHLPNTWGIALGTSSSTTFVLHYIVKLVRNDGL